MNGHLGGESVVHVAMGDTMRARSLLVNAVSTARFKGIVAHVPWPHVPPRKKVARGAAAVAAPLVLDEDERELNLVPAMALHQFLAPIWSIKKNGRKPRLKYHVPFGSAPRPRLSLSLTGASHGISPLGCKIDESTSTDDDRSLLIITMTLALIADACHCPLSSLTLHRRVRHNLVFTDYLPFAIDMPRFIERHQGGPSFYRPDTPRRTLSWPPSASDWRGLADAEVEVGLAGTWRRRSGSFEGPSSRCRTRTMPSYASWW
jgi:hypothetical protein